MSPLVIPYLIRYGLPVAIIGAAWWWHSSTVSDLESQIAERDKGLAACITGRTNDRSEWTAKENERLGRMLDAEAAAMREAIENAERQAKAQARAAQRARVAAKTAESNLADLQEEFARKTDECHAVSDNTRRLLDSLANGGRADRLEGASLPKTAAETNPPGGVDGRPD